MRHFVNLLFLLSVANAAYINHDEVQGCPNSGDVVKVGVNVQDYNIGESCTGYTVDLSDAIGLRNLYLPDGICPVANTVVKVGDNVEHFYIGHSCTGYTLEHNFLGYTYQKCIGCASSNKDLTDAELLQLVASKQACGV